MPNRAIYTNSANFSDGNTENRGTTCVGTNGGPSFFGTYDQGGNVSEYTEQSVLFRAADSYIPPEVITGPGFDSTIYVSHLLTPTPFPEPPPIRLNVVFLRQSRWSEFLGTLPQEIRNTLPQNMSNLVFIHNEDTEYLRTNMSVYGNYINADTRIDRILGQQIDINNDGQLYHPIFLTSSTDYLSDSPFERFDEVLTFSYYRDSNNVTRRDVSNILVQDHTPLSSEYSQRTLFLTESQLGDIRYGWAVYGENIQDQTFVNYVTAFTNIWSGGPSEPVYEVVLNKPYIRDTLSFTTISAGQYANIPNVTFLSGYYDHNNLPGPLPEPVEPLPVNTITTSFGFAKEIRGGNFTSSVDALAKNSSLAFMVPDDHSPLVGFRIAGVSKKYTYVNALIYPSFGNNVVFIPMTDVATNLAAAEQIITSRMHIEGNGLQPNTKIITVNNIFLDIGDGSGTLEYLTVSVDRNFIDLELELNENGWTRSEIKIQNHNLSRLKNMVLIDQPGNATDGFDPGYGRVNYEYCIGKYPVTNSEYSLYLNNVASVLNEENLNTYYTPALSETELGMSIGIDRRVVQVGDVFECVYAPADHMQDHPVVGITWIQAARYCNYMHNIAFNINSKNTNNGAYDLSQPLQTMARSSQARYFIPNRQEWYKAAYYDFSAGSFKYSKYPTRSDDEPIATEYNQTVLRWAFPDFPDPDFDTVIQDPIRRGVYTNPLDESLFDRYKIDDLLGVQPNHIDIPVLTGELNESGEPIMMNVVHTINKARWSRIFNAAIDRWDALIKHVATFAVRDPDSYIDYAFGSGTTYLPRFTDVRTNIINNLNSSMFINEMRNYRGKDTVFINFYSQMSGTLASCGVIGITTLARHTSTNVHMPMPYMYFTNINMIWDSQQALDALFENGMINQRLTAMSTAQWIDIMTHELGHALGLGGIVFRTLPDNLGLREDGSYLSNEDGFFRNTARQYNITAYNTSSGAVRPAVPLESTGGAGTVGSHWENDFIPDGYCFDGANCDEPVSYVGIANELMNGIYEEGSKISSLTTQLFIDMGYFENKLGITEERSFTPASPLNAQSVSTLRKFPCCLSNKNDSVIFNTDKIKKHF